VLDLYHGLWKREELTDNDVVICIDEKTGIGARYRHQSPPRPGSSLRSEHEYKRHGGCNYQNALIVGTGEVYGHYVASNTRANFERLVKNLMKHPIYQYADRMFWVTDNGKANHPNTFPRWAKKQYNNVKCLHLSVRASWLNQIELYFSILTLKSVS